MRYKVGWFIPQQILALTHLVPEVSQDDFVGILNATNACLPEVQQPFHMIIDNRIIKSEVVVSLEVILQTLPQLQQSPLRWIMMVLPHRVRDGAINRDIQQLGDIQLKYVDTIVAALDTLQAMAASLDWESHVSDFFAEDIQ